MSSSQGYAEESEFTEERSENEHLSGSETPGSPKLRDYGYLASEEYEFYDDEDWNEELYFQNLYRPRGEEQELIGFSEDEEEASTIESSQTAMVQKPGPRESRKRSLFVHSSPSYFPDVNRARKSVFGSIFLRTTANVNDEHALLKTVAESSYSMIQSLLSSFDKILSGGSLESDRRQLTIAYKDSVLRSLENHGITRTYSDGSAHWDIYPITHSCLFAIQVGDHIHQTRDLSKVEDRILNGTIQSLKFPFSWPTDSIWTGSWDSLGMAGRGTYLMPHGVSYFGKMANGNFHDDCATLTYPNKFKALNCVFTHGKLINCDFQFPDMLNLEKTSWGYCKFPDRRFWSEVRNGLKPAKISQKTELDPPRKIPAGCYDTNDGFYNPHSMMLTGPTGELLKVPICEEDLWIRKNCRKGFLEMTGFRPDLYENWFDYDEKKISDILKHQDLYRHKKITYEELQLFYGEIGILPEGSKYQRKKSPSELAFEAFEKTIPNPVILKQRILKKYQGHHIGNETLRQLAKRHSRFSTVSSTDRHKSSEKLKKTASGFESPSSKFSFKPSLSINMTNDISFQSASILKNMDVRRSRSADSKSVDSQYTGLRSIDMKNIIEKKMLEKVPILRPPFHPLPRIVLAHHKCKKSKPCEDKKSMESKSSEVLGENDLIDSFNKKKLRDFMRDIILDAANHAFIEEKVKLNKRIMWGRKIVTSSREKIKSHEKCLGVLRELFLSIPDKEEYCDSDSNTVMNLKAFAEDKYGSLKYWGKRMFMLDFPDTELMHKTP